MLIYVVMSENLFSAVITLVIYCRFRSRAIYYTRTIPGGILPSNRLMLMHFKRVTFSLELRRIRSHVFGI